MVSPSQVRGSLMPWASMVTFNFSGIHEQLVGMTCATCFAALMRNAPQPNRPVMIRILGDKQAAPREVIRRVILMTWSTWKFFETRLRGSGPRSSTFRN
jgi:hypothetical protein